MKISDFIMLSIEEKSTIVLHTGILIGKRRTDNFFIFLFQLDGFYAEVFCNLDDKSVQEYRVFQSTSQLQPYLETVSIDGLF